MDFSQIFQDLDLSLSTDDDFGSFPVSTNDVNMLSSSDENIDSPFPIKNKKQIGEMKHVSRTESPSSGENISELNAHTSLKENLKNQHHKFQCKECSKAFTSKKTLKRHEWIHRNECKPLFKCHVCDFGYTRKEHLRNHLKDYMASMYVCNHCNKKFCRKRHLKDHVCQQNVEKLQTVNCEIKNTSYVFSDKVFKCSEENNLDIWSFLISLKIKIEIELYQLNKKND